MAEKIEPCTYCGCVCEIQGNFRVICTNDECAALGPIADTRESAIGIHNLESLAWYAACIKPVRTHRQYCSIVPFPLFDEVKRLRAKENQVICAGCGEVVANCGDPDFLDKTAAHIMECKIHPLKPYVDKIEELTRALAAKTWAESLRVRQDKKEK